MTKTASNSESVERIKELESTEELSKRWRRAKSWLYARTKERGPDAIPRINFGKYVMFEPDKVDAWLRSRSSSR
jgi:hypothetical protein